MGRCLIDFNRKFSSEIIEIICDLLFIAIEHRGEDVPFEWLKSRFDQLEPSNRKHRDNLFVIFDQIGIVKNIFKATTDARFSMKGLWCLVL